MYSGIRIIQKIQSSGLYEGSSPGNAARLGRDAL